MSHRNQSGFILMAVAIIVTIALLGLIGWSLYANYYSKQNSVATSSSQSPKPPISNPSNSNPTPQPTYLDIKELGIKIKLDDSIKDAIYTIHTKTDGSQFADISTQTLTNKSNGSCSPDNGSIASIGKVSGTPEQVFSGPGIDPVNNSTTFKFGTDTYVYIKAPQQICSQDPTVQDLASQQTKTFLNDFKTVQLDQ